METLLFKPSSPLRDNLVIIRAGSQSLHKEWLKDIDNRERTWDIAVSYFGEDDDYNFEYEEYFFKQKSFKYNAIFELITRNNIFMEYKSVWLPDDDIMCSFKDINIMFSAFSEYDLQIAQPSLTSDSFISHAITANDQRFDLRFTNFVEVMAPIFSKRALQRCLPSFSGARIGWGLDFVWPVLLGGSKTAMGVIDRVTVRHTRPGGSGSIYKTAKENGFPSPEAEMEDTMKRFGSSIRPMQVYGVIFK